MAVRAPALAAVAVDHGQQAACHPVAHAAAETPARMDLVRHRCPPKRVDLITGQLVLGTVPAADPVRTTGVSRALRGSAPLTGG